MFTGKKTAEKYLELISASTPVDALRSRRNVVSQFDPLALGAGTAAPTASIEEPFSSSAVTETVKRAAFLFRRGLSLKRRIDTHVAAYDTVGNVSLPKPTVHHDPRPMEGTSSGGLSSSEPSLLGGARSPRPRARKLSRPHTLSPAEPKDTPSTTIVVGGRPLTLASGVRSTDDVLHGHPPRRSPTSRTLASAGPSPLDARPDQVVREDSGPLRTSPDRPKPRRPPPVSGITRTRKEKEVAQVATAAGFEPIRGRKRSNSLKQGVQAAVNTCESPTSPPDEPVYGFADCERPRWCSISVARAPSLKGGRTGKECTSVDGSGRATSTSVNWFPTFGCVPKGDGPLAASPVSAYFLSP